MSENKRCPSCGYMIKNKEVICPLCGKILDEKAIKKGHPILTIIFLFALWPVGLLIMWATETFKKRTRVAITIIYILLFLCAIGMVCMNKPTITKGNGTAYITTEYSKSNLIGGCFFIIKYY